MREIRNRSVTPGNTTVRPITLMMSFDNKTVEPCMWEHHPPTRREQSLASGASAIETYKPTTDWQKTSDSYSKNDGLTSIRIVSFRMMMLWNPRAAVKMICAPFQNRASPIGSVCECVRLGWGGVFLFYEKHLQTRLELSETTSLS